MQQIVRVGKSRRAVEQRIVILFDFAEEAVVVHDGGRRTVIDSLRRGVQEIGRGDKVGTGGRRTRWRIEMAEESRGLDEFNTELVCRGCWISVGFFMVVLFSVGRSQ